MSIQTFNEKNFFKLCDLLAASDPQLKNILEVYDYPPLFSRTPTFSTLIHIILEQQVSLASAKTAFLKLQEKIGHIEPEKLLQLNDVEMKACYFSKQKMLYARELAKAVLNEELKIEELILLNDEEVRRRLKQIKGIGDWTVDVFMMMALHRSNCFPHSDIALIKSMKEAKALQDDITKDEVILIAESWKPFRTIAAFMLWHAYIKKRGIVL